MKSFFRRSMTSQNDIATPQPPSTQSMTDTSSLTIVELFQSQGCNSCPPTNDNLLALSDPNILALTYHVTYWDYLGWKDTFGQRDFDARQRDYVQFMGLRSAFTPQAIVNGRASGVGNTTAGLRRVINEGSVSKDDATTKVAVREIGNKLAIRVTSKGNFVATGGRLGRHTLHIWLVQYDPQRREVQIKSGENTGRLLPHRNVVRSVTLIGEASFDESSDWVVEKQSDGLNAAILVQHGVGGPILGATVLSSAQKE